MDSRIRLLIVDCDGTLYFQRPFRIVMAFKLLWLFLKGTISIKTLRVIKTYRHIHEHWGECRGDGTITELQYRETARLCGVSPEEVSESVEAIIYKLPLPMLYRFRDHSLAEILAGFRASGGLVVVYSDYPAYEKLRALDLECDGYVSSLDPEIMAMKPNPKAVFHLFDKYKVNNFETVMVGDRYDKDGITAKNAAIDFVYLGKTKASRLGAYERLRKINWKSK